MASRNGIARDLGTTAQRLRKVEGNGLPIWGETTPTDYELIMGLMVTLRVAGWSVQKIRAALAASNRIATDPNAYQRYVEDEAAVARRRVEHSEDPEREYRKLARELWTAYSRTASPENAASFRSFLTDNVGEGWEEGD